MKHIIKLLSITAAFSTIILGSCTKEDHTLEQISDTYQGRYKCSSMVWNGNPIDVDGDGLANTELSKEFPCEKSLLNNWQAALLSPVRIFPIISYKQENRILIDIPMQFTKYDKVSKQYSLRDDCANNQYLYFSFTVREDGSMSYSTRNDLITYDRYWDAEWEIEGVDYPTTCGHHILSLEEGSFSVRIIGTYYDFASQQLMTGPVDLTYERFSKSLY